MCGLILVKEGGSCAFLNMAITADLIEKCRKGQTLAQVELYRLCYPVLMPVCQRYVTNKSEAAEHLNTAFYSVLKSLKTFSFSNEKSFLQWSRKIVVNAMIDAYRKEKRYRESNVTLDHQSLNGVAKESIANEAVLALDVQHILRLIERLPQQQKTVFNLYVIDDYSHKEIANLLGLSENTSRWYLAQARKSMQSKLTKLAKQQIQSSDEAV